MSDMSPEVQRLLALAQSQQQTIDRLLGVVHELTAQEAEPAPVPDQAAVQERKPGPIKWLELSQEERLGLWEELMSFLESLVFRYNMQLEILPCWWKHNDVVEEVTALWTTYKDCFKEGSPRTANWDWMGKFYNSRERLGDMFLSCRDGHIETRIKGWMSDAAKEEFAQAVRAGWPVREDVT